MVFLSDVKRARGLLLACLAVIILLTYRGFFRSLWSVWAADTEFAYGALVPVLIAYLLWRKKGEFQKLETNGWGPAILGVAAGCLMQVLASFSGALVLSSLSLALILVASVGFLWGKESLGIVTLPLSLILLMAPVPTYLADDVTWRLQIAASAASSAMLQLLGVPVYQDGNLLVLANYILEVKQACSGSRSFFAILGLALVLSLTSEKKWWVRTALICAAPLLSVSANLIRIVGTGIVAYKWGNVAANESLHWVWGVLVFMLAVVGLLGLQKVLRWLQTENTSGY